MKKLQNSQKTGKSKVISTTYKVDENTGEVSDVHTVRCRVESKYRKFYCDFDYAKFGGPMRALIAITRRMSYSGDKDGGNVVRIDRTLFNKMADEAGVSVGRFRAIVREFSESGVLRRIGRGAYQVNPYMCGIGDWFYIEKLRYEWDKAKAAEQAE